MFNGKYRTIDSVIENILRDTDYYNEIDRFDAIEWAMRAMQLIGAPMVYDQVITIIDFTNWRIPLPLGMVNLLGVRDTDTKQTFIPDDDPYIIYNPENSAQSAYEQSPLDVIGAQGRDKGARFIPTYKISGGCLYTNVKEGTVDLLLELFPKTEDDCLLIPDEERYLLAVESYIIFKMDNKLYRRGVLSKSIRDESEQNWLWYVNSAFARIVTPNVDEAESLKNQLQKIRTDTAAHQYGWKYLNVPTVKKF